jgi:hypothetical protein
MLPDPWLENLTAMRFETLVRTFLVEAHQPRIPRHISGEDRGKTTLGGHWQKHAPSGR